MWDYVIIGSGTAGSVLAHELSANGGNKVLLVEAGGKPSLTVKMPAGMVKLFRSKQDWAFESEPQQACGGRTIFTPRGKMLGGSANMNAQIHQWCHPADFDGWVEAGAVGWGWDEVRPVFRAMERVAGKDGGDQRRGGLGPMRIDRLKTPNPVTTAFVEAAKACGLDGDGDYNGGAYSGAWFTEIAHRKGRRFSTYDAYLKPAMKRPNLSVVAERAVTRILFEGKRAVGVALEDGEIHRAGKGVVLSAGAFGSPQLLMLSGLGDAARLRGLGIDMVHHSPGIGDNLQDHAVAGLGFGMKRPISLKAAETLPEFLKWLLFGRGMLTSNALEAFAFTSVVDRKAPDLELMFLPVVWSNQALDPPEVHGYTIAAVPVAPKSRGRLTLKSASAGDPPAIDFGLLSDPGGIDAKVLLAGLRLARRIAETEPLKAETTGELPLSAEAQGDEALMALARGQIQTVYHPSGTCRMGSDAGAPVDSRLRVNGVDGLWVVDASVMPNVPRGHPNAVVAMIARRAAGWIGAQTAG
jgi:choline dehydrogenase